MFIANRDKKTQSSFRSAVTFRSYKELLKVIKPQTIDISRLTARLIGTHASGGQHAGGICPGHYSLNF